MENSYVFYNLKNILNHKCYESAFNLVKVLQKNRVARIIGPEGHAKGPSTVQNVKW